MYFMTQATSLSHCRLNMHAGHACTTRNHECMSDDDANNVIGRPGKKGTLLRIHPLSLRLKRRFSLAFPRGRYTWKINRYDNG